MTQGSITRHLIQFALPLLAGNVFQQLYNMVDTETFAPSRGIVRDDLVVASVATLTRKKGVFHLLAAWPHVLARNP